MLERLRGVKASLNAQPTALKVVLIVVAFALLVLLSRALVVLASIALVVSLVAVVIRLFRRRSLRGWGIVALVSLVSVFAFTGIANAVYGPPEQPAQRQAAAPEPSTEEPETASVEAAEDEAAQSEEAAAETATQPETTTETADETASTPPEPEDEQAEDEDEGGGYDATVTVTRVVDGDTIEVSPDVDGIEDVRLIGVDTPETKEPGCEVQPYGQEASDFTTSELEGEEVQLEFDEEREDRYGRLLAYVYDDGDMFNETLLEQGYAQATIFPPNDKYEDRFEQAQMEAQATERGIWGLAASEQAQLADRDNGIGSEECQPKAAPTPPAPDPAPNSAPAPIPDIPPAPAASGGSYPPISQNTCPANAPIKGNQSGIYHVQGGQFYSRTNPEECFASEGDAQAAGYRKSQR